MRLGGAMWGGVRWGEVSLCGVMWGEAERFGGVE